MHPMEDAALVLIFTCVLFVVAFLLKAVVKWLQDYLRIVRLMKLVPGPLTVPILGNALNFIIRPQSQYLDEMKEFTKMHHPFFRLWSGPLVCTTHISSWKYAQQILNSSTQIEKYLFYYFLDPWLGRGLLTSTGSKWHLRRKLLTPAFHRSILDSFQEVVSNKSTQLIERLKTTYNVSQPFDITPLIWQCSLDIICETAMGTNMNLQTELGYKDAVYIQAVKDATSLFTRRCVRPWLYPNIFYNISSEGRKYHKCIRKMHNFTNKVIKARTEEYFQTLGTLGNDQVREEKSMTTKRKAFLDLLIEAAYSEGHEKRPTLSDQDIREEVDTFMFEGHDTTASAISWAVFLLGHHPHIQEKVVEEIEEVLGDDLLITTEKLSELRLLERCIKESLRLYPSVPFIARKLNEDIKLGDCTLPSQTGVFILIYFLHRDPEVFPNPEKFDPDNFLPEICEKRPPFAYVPFSAGPRNCIGQKFAMLELKTVLCHILKNFKIESVDKPEDLKIRVDVIIRSENGINVCLYPRT